MADYHFTLKAPTREHVKGALREAKWWRSIGETEMADRFVAQAKDIKRWIDDRSHEKH